MPPHPSWPSLPLAEWGDTCETLHGWTQVVGKVRMAFTPLGNHCHTETVAGIEGGGDSVSAC